MTTHPLTESQTMQLLSEVQHLRQQVEQLSRLNQDLQIALSTTAEHGDLIEAELQLANQKLKLEVAERIRAEANLKLLLEAVSKRSDDLEIIIQTIMEHGDVMDAQWDQKWREERHLANIDGLTQIANRRRLDEYLTQQWKQMLRDRQPIAIILCDIDHFKQYNDTYGHLAGDDCLKLVAQVIARSLKRPSDLAARYGGEEFVAVLPQTDLAGAIVVAQQIQTAIQQLQIPQTQSSTNRHITLSMGVSSLLPAHDLPAKTLLDMADHLLYMAKQQGRDRIVSG
ncbi:diguanylate cyclase domain-containing protein [Pantanalinema sp. GBBB05]|uniref:diguanylate cyclase n=1 Tax=Pantanalinema sp. GBBB05 TaxID=2604139 RepID=UPI001DC9A690|nr:GGDEF domain-containing protein [Pantanalinema sp. GBBB05]